MSKKKTTEQIIDEFKNIHGDEYDYSKVNYNGRNVPVCIICKVHGEFWQTPKHHLLYGCQQCARKLVGLKCRKTVEQFIVDARKVHGDKYDYSKVVYINAHTEVCIICLEHGEFWQTPNDHLNGKGCKFCKISHLERDVMLYLDEHNIKYEYQKYFSWLGKQSLDFYLPKYNIGIECQGKQHFIQTKFGLLEENISRDIQKKKLCDENGLEVVYIFNKDDYENIPEMYDECKILNNISEIFIKQENEG